MSSYDTPINTDPPEEERWEDQAAFQVLYSHALPTWQEVAATDPALEENIRIYLEAYLSGEDDVLEAEYTEIPLRALPPASDG